MSFAYSSSPIALGFQELIATAQLTARDLARFDSHRASIRLALGGHRGLNASRVDLIGSVARRTAVRGMSDADLLAVIPRASASRAGALHSSDTVLEKLRTTLVGRFRRTDVGRDRQAVVVDFDDGCHPVDVVPAIWEDQSGFKNYPVHLIPDGNGWWMPTSPSSHNVYLAFADRSAAGKLKYSAQIFKYWRMSRAVPVPISGFHVELLLAAERLCEGARTYSAITRDLLVRLSDRDCAALNDPLRISGRIRTAITEAKRESAARTVKDAAYHADLALAAEYAGNQPEASRRWNIVFNGSFPR